MEIIAIKKVVLVILFYKFIAIDGGEILENVYAKICYHFKHFCGGVYPLLPGYFPYAAIQHPIAPIAPIPPIPPAFPIQPGPPPLPIPQVPAPNSPLVIPIIPGCPPYIIVCPLGSISPTIAVPNIDIRLAPQIIVRTFNGCPCIDQRVGPALSAAGLGGRIIQLNFQTLFKQMKHFSA